MAEKNIQIDSINPLELYGINDSKLAIIKNHFPKLKIVARGTSIKVTGEDNEIMAFEQKINEIIESLSRFGAINEANISKMLTQGNDDSIQNQIEQQNDVLVFGNHGLIIKARTSNQRKMVNSIEKNDILFAIGPAGTGKTYTAVALAVRALKNRQVKKIILTRPAVEAGEHLGFLPGDLKEKLDPYLQPLYDALLDMIPADKLQSHLESRVIQIAPLAFMRGRTLDHAFVILDEAQNATEAQLKMFLTRMGSSAKFVITGDVTQTDLPKTQPSGLPKAVKILQGISGIDFVNLSGEDVIRHRLVKKIIEVYDKQ